MKHLDKLSPNPGANQTAETQTKLSEIVIKDVLYSLLGPDTVAV